MEQILADHGIIEDCNLEVSGISADFLCGHDGSRKSTPIASASAPTISFTGAEAGKKYCLICTDPDAPSREEPAYREFVHWVVSDVLSSSAETIVEYLGPGPPCNSGLHRYVFLLFEQLVVPMSRVWLQLSKVVGERKRSPLRKTAGLGPLVAVDFYEAEWDESVDAVHEAIGFLPPEKYRSPKQKAANP